MKLVNNDYNKTMKVITLCLMVFSLLMVVSCSGGDGSGGGTTSGAGNTSVDNGDISGDDNGMGNGSTGNTSAGNTSVDNGDISGNDKGMGNGSADNASVDNGGGGFSIPDKVQIAILPVASSFNSPAGFIIRWENIAAFKQAGQLQRLHINLTRSDTAMRTSHPIDVSSSNRNTYRLSGLEDGVAYKFAEMVELEYSGNVSHNRSIEFSLEENREDNAGNGIVVGKDFDGDGRADSVDEDDDDDMVDDVNEAEGCTLTVNCDGDFLADDRDIDADGNGLIEISNAEELNAVRFVLDGTGFKEHAEARLVTLGCGNGRDVMECSGYELVRDISLVDFIARTNATAGWQPIAHDTNTERFICSGDKFTGTFDGNGFEVRGLFINRLTERCLGLFGQASGTIRHLGVIVDRIGGSSSIGGLAGSITEGARIIQSYAVNGEIRGNTIGGLVGVSAGATRIIQSYAVNGIMTTSSNVGGLLGAASMTDIIQSYAVIGRVERSTHVTIGNAGGLVGHGPSINMTQSYSVSGRLSGSLTVGGLVGFDGTATNTYWDTETSGRNNDGATGSLGQTTTALRSPTDYEDIYATWDDGAGVVGINDNTTIWCDENHNGRTEKGEMRNAGHPRGDNRVWDFGNTTDYPALRCTGDSLADQRAWWYLNTTSHKPQLNQTYLDAYLDGSLP